MKLVVYYDKTACKECTMLKVQENRIGKYYTNRGDMKNLHVLS